MERLDKNILSKSIKDDIKKYVDFTKNLELDNLVENKFKAKHLLRNFKNLKLKINLLGEKIRKKHNIGGLGCNDSYNLNFKLPCEKRIEDLKKKNDRLKK